PAQRRTVDELEGLARIVLLAGAPLAQEDAGPLEIRLVLIETGQAQAVGSGTGAERCRGCSSSVHGAGHRSPPPWTRGARRAVLMEGTLCAGSDRRGRVTGPVGEQHVGRNGAGDLLEWDDAPPRPLAPCCVHAPRPPRYADPRLRRDRPPQRGERRFGAAGRQRGPVLPSAPGSRAPGVRVHALDAAGDRPASRRAPPSGALGWCL